jgi:hypothetical protein
VLDPLEKRQGVAVKEEEVFELRRQSELRAERRRLVTRAVAIMAVVLALIGAAVYYFYFRAAEEAEPEIAEPAVEEPAAEPPPAVEEPSAAAQPLPTLNESDWLVRGLAEGLSSNPALTSWLATDDLVRRFVVVVDNIAEGVTPAEHVPFLAPDGEFRVSERGERLVVDPRTYRRYDLVADVFVSLDSEGCAEIYRTLKPLFEEAYGELGYPGRTFDETLARAFRRLRETPVIDRPIEVEPLVITYEYADSDLANLAAVQRHFLRLGPRNIRRIQAKLRELSGALEIGR